MPRGYVWAHYTDDAGGVWGLQVDADYQLQTGRGFAQLAAAGTVPLPRGWLARRVVGVEETGRAHTATVASVEAPLWTGSERTFDIVDTDGQLQTCTVVRWLDERTRSRPGAAGARRD